VKQEDIDSLVALVEEIQEHNYRYEMPEALFRAILGRYGIDVTGHNIAGAHILIEDFYSGGDRYLEYFTFEGIVKT
jgi:hypothetical protein